MRRFLFLILVLVIPFFVYSHSGKARYHVIIDTDCAPDDLRSITYMLASQDFEVIAITTSDGLLHPDEGYIKVKSLLKSLNHEGIPVAYGITVKTDDSRCHNICENVAWGDTSDISLPAEAKAVDLLRKAIDNEDEPVYIICMGPLTNIRAITGENVIRETDTIMWYCSGLNNEKGTNYVMDKAAADDVLQDPVNKIIVSNNNEPDLAFNDEFFKEISGLNNKYSRLIKSSHSNKQVMEKMNSGFYALWDDLLPVYLQKRDLFISNNIDKNTITAIPEENSGSEIKERIIDILNLKDNRENKVFSEFPQSPELFRDDVSIYSEEIISNYGISEWRAVTLTNELHGHLGIYAVVGAKMGILVREYFAIGLDDLMIVSFAGKTPPLSCLNDGLQVSTGATLGHGLIEISDSKNKGPYADFTFKNKKIRVSLKDAYRQQVIIDIKKGIADYGNLTPEYWEFIRQLAIRYWKDWDRNNIFEIETL